MSLLSRFVSDSQPSVCRWRFLQLTHLTFSKSGSLLLIQGRQDPLQSKNSSFICFSCSWLLLSISLFQDSWQLYKIASVSQGNLIKEAWGEGLGILSKTESRGQPDQCKTQPAGSTGCSRRTRLCVLLNLPGQRNHQVLSSERVKSVEFSSVLVCLQDLFHSLLITSVNLISINNRFVWRCKDERKYVKELHITQRLSSKMITKLKYFITLKGLLNKN